MKKIALLLALLLCIGVVAGCSQETSSEQEGKTVLSLYSSIVNDSEREMLSSIVADYEKEHPNIHIDMNFPGEEYENMLRVKMAANDLPDLFDTHGWGKLRYGEYTADLQDMDWVQNLDPNLDQILKDENGKVYALPLNQAKDGITYNKTLLDKYDIEPPETTEELMTAMKLIKEKSKGEVVPFWFAGYDKSSIAQFFDQFATPLLITDKKHDHRESLKNGTFDWPNYTALPAILKEMNDQKLLNVDAVTAKPSQLIDLMAQNKIAFTISGGSLGQDVANVNPEVQLGIMPNPAIHEGDEPSWIGGERHTLAAWKDSRHLDEAKQFLAFIAEPENAKKMAEATSLPSALTNVEAEIYYSESYKRYEDVRVEPYFDRVYLPNGMWDVMGTTGQELLAGMKTPEEVSKKMREEYLRLRNK
ncbi:extracellular solute-binding protein [Bacillus gobiensis]|uniref:ABC transporter substrate-binding protein n=1 Tax=Bacillus gobiensis TaxID=1441095 RepID=UPI003D1D392A